MRFKSALAVNWAGYVRQDFEFGDRTLLAGETGAGKSSLLDALVAVLSGGDQRVGPFNSAQSDRHVTGAKGGRTLASYVCGSNGAGNYLRKEGAYGYVAIAFEPDVRDGKHGKPFTAIVGLEARPDPLSRNGAAVPVGDVMKTIVVGRCLTSADFVDEHGAVRDPAAQKLWLRKLSQTVQDYSTAKEFRARMCGGWRDQNLATEEDTKATIEALVAAIAYKTISNLDELIREDILPAVDHEDTVRRLMATMKDVSTLQRESGRLKNNLAHLDGALENLSIMRVKASEAYVLERAIVAREAVTQENKISVFEDEIEELVESKEKDEKRLAAQRVLLGENAEKLAAVRATLLGNTAYSRKELLDSRISGAEDACAVRAAKIRKDHFTLATSKTLAAAMPAAARAAGLAPASISTSEAVSNAFSAVPSPSEFAALMSDLDAEDGRSAFLSAVSSASHAASTWKAACGDDPGSLASGFDEALRKVVSEDDGLKKEVVRLETEIRALEAGKVLYPSDLDDFFVVLKERLPRCRPRWLCDVVEISDPEWQGAIEGYLDRDRFTILYDPEYEGAVLDLMREHNARQPKNNKARVAQIGLAVSDWRQPPERSATRLVVTEDETARKYMESKFGTLLRVDDKKTLLGTRRGIMVDGSSTGGYVYGTKFKEVGERFFGIEARKNRKFHLKDELEKTKDERKVLSARIQSLQPFVRAMGAALPDMAEDAGKLASDRADIVRWNEEIAGLDLKDVAESQRMKDALEIEETAMGAVLDRLAKDIGGYDADVKTKTNQIAAVRKVLDDGLSNRASKARKDVEDLLAKLDEDLAASTRIDFETEIDTIRPQENNTRENAQNRLNALRKEQIPEIAEAFASYDDGGNDRERLDAMVPALETQATLRFFDDLERTVASVTAVRDEIRDSGLPEKHDECVESERKFTTAFMTNFCARILADVNGVATSIERINVYLKGNPFGGDTFSITQTPKEEYRQYTNLFRKLNAMANNAGVDLFAEELKLDDKEAAVFSEIQSRLLDHDEDKARAELLRISDYRNYRKYDFLRVTSDGSKVPLSEHVSGSGGETETPVYAVRAAVIANAFKLTSDVQGARPRFLIIDEGFLHMDETRSAQVLDFLCGTLGLQVVFAASTKTTHPIAGLFDKRINFVRYNAGGGRYTKVTHVDVNSAAMREKTKAERAAIRAYVESVVPHDEPRLQAAE